MSAIDTRELYKKHSFKVVAILDWKTETPVMTGTLICKRLSDDVILPLILTNKHVGQLVVDGQIKILIEVSGVKKVITASYELSHNIHDLALFSIPYEEIGSLHVWENTFGKHSWISTDDFKFSKDIEEGLYCVYLGYPLGKGVETNKYKPLIRRGMVSYVNENGQLLLIDGSASHGNSGSPVFSQEDGKFIGIIFGFFNDHISLFDDNKICVATIPENSGIAIACTADTIIAGIDKIVGKIKGK
jgi:Trypsin-like peptidase domain